MPDNQLRDATPAELAVELGGRIRALRLQQDLTQATLADKAGISVRALRQLEAGAGSSVITLLSTLKALGVSAAMDSLAPVPTVSPMAMLRQAKSRQRGSR